MDGQAPSPQTTLVILLGASEWPDSPDFPGSKAFTNAVNDFRKYLLDPHQFGLSEENLLNLFDTDQGPDRIDREIRQFLDRHTSGMKQGGNAPRDLLLYFVGHGGFVGRNSEYYLAVRSTSSENPAVSGIRIESLATTITDKARYLRRIIILDCCYASAAFTAFQAEGPAQVAIRQTIDVFKERARTVGKGTTLLCSSGKKITSLFTPDGSYTMFSKALFQVLSTGDPRQQDKIYLSLREVADLTEEVLGSLLDEKAPRPEIHSPDQSEGDVAYVPFFPNLAGGIVPAPSPSPRIRRSAGFSRRTLVGGLVGLSAASGITWLILYEAPQLFPGLRPTATSTPVPPGTTFFIYRGHWSPVSAVVWSPNGRRIASGAFGSDQTVQIFDADTGGHIVTYYGHSNSVRAVVWSPNSKYIASGSDDKTVQVWDTATKNTLFTYHGHSDVVVPVAWSPNGRRIASGGADKTVQVWDAFTGSNVYSYHGHSAFVYGVAWSPDGNLIVSGGDDKTLQIWDATTGSLAYTYHGHSDRVNGVAWSPDGKRIASISADKTVQVWDWTGNPHHTIIYRGHSDFLIAVAWSPDSKRIASGGFDNTVRVWDSTTGNTFYVYHDHASYVFGVAWSPDGTRIASSGSYDKTVRVWQAV